DNILYSSEVLHENQYISYGPYEFIMQHDCNLVLYESGNPTWASNTGGLALHCRATLQTDGNLVVQNSANRIIWQSNTGTGTNGDYLLVLQKNGNVVIVGPPIWATGTGR
uniref:Mannose-specific lectin n=1 Tax=Aloe arborescens TaxID=45385 RepID=LEC_ALOAR|nr:RecName: Full=Mannose-specific lectin; AltName: Full=Agglutinin; Contains: RecName: Full=Mannose-specific lectin heavy chain; Contains: RecName: Full=Mannose-specific lectin light chain; Flags: Precursor [Aloe arborescens]